MYTCPDVRILLGLLEHADEVVQFEGLAVKRRSRCSASALSAAWAHGQRAAGRMNLHIQQVRTSSLHWDSKQHVSTLIRASACCVERERAESFKSGSNM